MEITGGLLLPDEPWRFINHSCEPNAYLYEALDEVFVGSLRPIRKGEEIRIDYGWKAAGGSSKMWLPELCHCGANTCRGFVCAEDYVPTTLAMLSPSLGKTTWDDVSAKRVDARSYESGGGYTPGENGTSSIKFNCPFCRATVIAYLWSISGCGKRCECCGAIFGSGGGAYRKHVDRKRLERHMRRYEWKARCHRPSLIV